MKAKHSTGFSLVELSIVLVILGLLTGGILAGQSLIRAAELRSISTELTRYATASRAFQDKYFGLPGDLLNATAFWGKDNAACSGHTGTAATPGTCNGDGDGIIETGSVAGGTGERNQFWKQLALAGIIEGSYTGLSDPTRGVYSDVAANAPASKIKTGIWSTFYATSTFNNYDFAYALDYGNALRLGGPANGTYSHEAVITAEEAWNVDTKLDDGMPGQGTVVTWNPTVGTNCTSTTSATDFTATYSVTVKSISCPLWFRRAIN